VAATLYPFDFSIDEQVSIRGGFSPGSAIRHGGNGLVIGTDGAFSQPFRGKIGELRIYRVALAPDEVAKEAQRLAVVSSAHGAASYSFTESSGAVLRDDSGNGNHGKLVGGPRWIREGGQGALFFDGSGQYVHVPDNPSIDIGGRSITISMRLMLEGSPSDEVIVARPWRWGVMTTPYYQYGVEYRGRDRSVDFYFADIRGRVSGPFSMRPPLGVWTHVAFVFNAGNVRGYVDGRELLAAEIGQVWDLFDIVVNLLLFVPLGFGLAAVGESLGVPPEKAIPLILALGAALSLGVEVMQCWLPDREPSLIDVAVNSVSSALGAALHFAAGSELFERLKRLAG
jgi:VanZ family protein